MLEAAPTHPDIALFNQAVCHIVLQNVAGKPSNILGWHGLEITLENLPYTSRAKRNWSTPLGKYGYGEFVDVHGMDGDSLDVFVDPIAAALVDNVYIATLRSNSGSCDEQKVFIGPLSLEGATQDFQALYPPGFLMGVLELSVGEFLTWCASRPNHGTAISKAAQSEAENKHRDEVYSRFRSSVNMSAKQVLSFAATGEGKVAGLSRGEAAKQGIASGRQRPRQIARLLGKPKESWTAADLSVANRVISFISRMKGAAGPIRDEKGRLSRKATSLLLWGFDPR